MSSRNPLPIPEAFALSARLMLLTIQDEYANLAEYPGILKVKVSEPPEEWEIECHAQPALNIDGCNPTLSG